jgi:hypothetical protein
MGISQQTAVAVYKIFFAAEAGYTVISLVILIEEQWS